MNFFNKKALVVLAALSFGGSMLGVSWQFENRTKKPLMIDMQFGNQVYWYLTDPGKVADFSWTAMDCYKLIRITEYDKADAAKVNPKLANLPHGAYGSASTPGGCQASAQDVQTYFNSKTWHSPFIIYPRRTEAINMGVIHSAISSIGSSAEMVKQLVAMAESSKDNAVTKFDFGFGKVLERKLLESHPNLTMHPTTSTVAFGCPSQIQSIHSIEFEVPSTKKKESAFIFIKRD